MLETEIKNLTAQIEKLNNNFEALFNAANATTTEQPPKTKTKEPKQEEPKQEDQEQKITAQDIKDLCLLKARASAGNKAKIKSILAEKGANLVDDLAEADYEEVRNKIGAL